VRLLVDANLSPRVAKALGATGHDVVHVADLGMHSAKDDQILDRAALDDRVIVSSDTDFGTLLARRNTAKPSFVLLRHINDLTPSDQTALLLHNLPAVELELLSGAVVTITRDRMRVRALPIHGR
jgi:predicted nuclease of predicted toxin-antitoxin system